jgi:hypothetical protein
LKSAPARFGSSGIRFDAQSVVYSGSELLLAAKVAFRRLDRYVAEQELNLIEFPTRKMAEAGAGTPIMPAPALTPQITWVDLGNQRERTIGDNGAA